MVKIMKTEQVDDVIDYLKEINQSFNTDIFFNQSRMTILAVLIQERPLTMSEISRRTEIAYKDVLRHLDILEEQGVIIRNEHKDEQNHPVYITLKKSSFDKYYKVK